MKIVQDLASDPPPAIFAIGAKSAYIAVQEVALHPLRILHGTRPGKIWRLWG